MYDRVLNLSMYNHQIVFVYVTHLAEVPPTLNQNGVCLSMMLPWGSRLLIAETLPQTSKSLETLGFTLPYPF